LLWALKTYGPMTGDMHTARLRNEAAELYVHCLNRLASRIIRMPNGGPRPRASKDCDTLWNPLSSKVEKIIFQTKQANNHPKLMLLQRTPSANWQACPTKRRNETCRCAKMATKFSGLLHIGRLPLEGRSRRDTLGLTLRLDAIQLLFLYRRLRLRRLPSCWHLKR